MENNTGLHGTVPGEQEESTARTHSVVINVLLWLKKNIKSYRYTGEKSKSVYKELLNVCENIESASFGDCFSALYNFYEKFNKNCIMCSRGIYFSRDEIRTRIVDCSFVIVKCAYMGTILDIPVALGYVNDFNFPYYKKLKEEYLSVCKREYDNYLNSELKEALYDCRFVSEDFETIKKKAKSVIHPFIFLLLGILAALYVVWRNIKALSELVGIFEVFGKTTSVISGLRYIFEYASGVSHNSYLSLFVILLEIIIIVIAIRLLKRLKYYGIHINNDILVAFKKNRLLAFQKKEQNAEIGIYHTKIDKISFRGNLKIPGKYKTYEVPKNKSYKLSVFVIILFVIAVFSPLNSSLENVFYSAEKGIRNYAETLELEGNVLSTAKEDITIYEKNDSESMVSYVLKKNSEYIKLDQTENDVEYIKIKYKHEYGYSEGFIRAADYKLSAPYEIPENYLKLGIGSADASSNAQGCTPDKVCDGNLNTYWKQEIGEYPENQELYIELLKTDEKTPEVKVIGIAPGNCYSQNTFLNGGRPESVYITFVDGDKHERVQIGLDDGGYFQFYSLNRPVKAEKIYIDMGIVKEGNNDRDAHVAEVSFYGLTTQE